MNKKQAIEAIREEINWCKKNPNTSGDSQSFEKGFVSGLETAKSILEKL
jgi:hypothetical protein